METKINWCPTNLSTDQQAVAGVRQPEESLTAELPGANAAGSVPANHIGVLIIRKHMQRRLSCYSVFSFLRAHWADIYYFDFFAIHVFYV